MPSAAGDTGVQGIQASGPGRDTRGKNLPSACSRSELAPGHGAQDYKLHSKQEQWRKEQAVGRTVRGCPRGAVLETWCDGGPSAGPRAGPMQVERCRGEKPEGFSVW